MRSPKGWSKNGQDSRSHETEDGEKIAATRDFLVTIYKALLLRVAMMTNCRPQ